MKKNKFLIIFFIIDLFFDVSFVQAIDIASTVEGAVNLIFNIAIPATTIIIIISAYIIMTAGGDPNAIERGKKSFLFAIIGLAILLTARTITNSLLSIIR